jgi:hypothetical protein
MHCSSKNALTDVDSHRSTSRGLHLRKEEEIEAVQLPMLLYCPSYTS